MKQLSILILLSFLTLSSCGQKADDTITTTTPTLQTESSNEYLLETGLGTITRLIDDQTGEAFVAKHKFDIYSLLLPSAIADTTCQRLVTQPCSNSIRYLEYNGCSVGNKTMTGAVSLTYSSASCNLSSDNDVVTKTTNNVTLTGPYGGSIITTSSNNGSPDYLSRLYQGGSSLKRNSLSNFSLTILGEHSGLLVNNSVRASVSVKTNSDVIITNGLSRGNRQLDSGAVEINHNIAKFSMVLVPTNVRYQANCCHPVSGNIRATFSGAKTGSLNYTFAGCGSGTVTSESTGATAGFVLSNCL